MNDLRNNPHDVEIKITFRDDPERVWVGKVTWETLMDLNRYHNVSAIDATYELVLNNIPKYE